MGLDDNFVRYLRWPVLAQTVAHVHVDVRVSFGLRKLGILLYFTLFLKLPKLGVLLVLLTLAAPTLFFVLCGFLLALVLKELLFRFCVTLIAIFAGIFIFLLVRFVVMMLLVRIARWITGLVHLRQLHLRNPGLLRWKLNLIELLLCWILLLRR